MWLIQELGAAKEYLLLSIREKLAERASLVLQTIGMMLNNSAFVILWLVFVNVYGGMNGWQAPEIIALNGFNALVYGIAFTLFGGTSQMRDGILNGAFDSVLLSPNALLSRGLTLGIRVSAVGDVLFGLICIGIYVLMAEPSLLSLGILTTLVIPSVCIMGSVMLISTSIAFFMPDSADLSRSFFELVFAPSMYPSGYFQGPVRFFLLYVIPSIAIAGLPVELLNNFSISLYLLVWCIAVLWMYVAWRVFLAGLRRYESGNMTGARAG